MTEQKSIKRFTLGKPGRIYRQAKLNDKYPCKLMINGVLDKQIDQTTVWVEVVEHSKRNRYGSELIFEPVALVDPAEAATLTRQALRLAEARRWLEYAERDVTAGFDHTRAISEAQQLAAGITELAERLAALSRRVAENRRAAAANRAAQEAKRATERAEREERIASERTAREQARGERHLVWVDEAPALNTPMPLHDRPGAPVVVYTQLGKSWYMDEEAADAIGPSLRDGYVCYAYYRPATTDEMRAMEIRQAAEHARHEAEQHRRARIAAIRERIMSEGECLAGTHTPEGERLLDTQTIYGGGDWFVLGSDIWYVRNNGADGDNWSYNNVRTGGAGAIGWRIPYDPALAAELRAFDAELLARKRG